MKRLKIILQYKYIFYVLLFINIIYVFLCVRGYEVDSNYDINQREFFLTVNDIKIDGDKLSLEFNENIIGTYYFKSEEEKLNNNLSRGDKIKVIGSLKLPNNNTIFNMFNYKKYLEKKGIKYIISIDEINLVNRSENIFIKLKNLFYKRISNIKYNSYLYALVLGKKDFIESETYESYKVNGITHLFSLSGLHVSMFSSIIMFILNKLRCSNKISFIITSIVLILFSFITSFPPSILRATIFFILLNINKLYNLEIKSKNILYLTFMILTYINPNYIYNLGFILSFTITFFIILFSEKYKVEGNIKSILVISIVSFLSSLPIIINMSYEINIIGFINNIFFIPYVSYIVFPICLLNIVFPFINGLLNACVIVMEFISNISSNLLIINLIFEKMNMYEIIIYYLLFILIIKGKKKYIFMFILLLVYLYLKPYIFKTNSIYIIDVSQGDSILMSINNENCLIDTGGKIEYKKEKWARGNKEFNLATSSLIPFFKSKGIKKLDYLIITHGDFDHMGEAINLVNNFKVEKVIFNCGEFNELERELIKDLEKKNIKYYSCINEINVDKYKLLFLNTKEYNNENDNSSVIYFNYNNYKFLFMGDAGVEVEEDLIKKYNLKDIDILKVGHHGSKTSSSKNFINEINPKYSIISVGKNNRYGHPNDSVLNNLVASKIYRTDQDGSILFKIKNNKLEIETCTP